MPFTLLIIGTVFLVASVRNTVTTASNGGKGLFPLLQGDFTGQNNFIYWLVAMFIIGAVGYIPKLRPVSVALMVLVILVLFLSKGNPGSSPGGGFFNQFFQGIGSTQTAQTTQTTSTTSSLLGGLTNG